MKIRVSNLDRLFSQYIRVRDHWTCRNCKKVSQLDGDGNRTILMDCAHIVSRSAKAIRWSPRNAICLCRGCHMKFTRDPFGWNDFVVDEIGEDNLDELRLMQRTAPPPKDIDKIIIGNDLIERIKELGEKPVCGLGKLGKKKPKKKSKYKRKVNGKVVLRGEE